MKALARDPNLWASELHTIGQVARSRGISEAVPAFEQLTERYQEVPPLLGALAGVYGELGWTPEYARIVKLRAERFPEHARREPLADRKPCRVDRFRAVIGLLSRDALRPFGSTAAIVQLEEENAALLDHTRRNAEGLLEPQADLSQHDALEMNHVSLASR